MGEVVSSFPEDEPIRTPEALVAGFISNTPAMFRELPIVDRRRGLDPDLVNLFDYRSMETTVDALLDGGDILVPREPEKGISEHFGYQYETYTTTAAIGTVPLAKRIIYIMLPVLNARRPRSMYRPRVTLGLYGLNDLGESVELELTRYQEPQMLNPVEVYRATIARMFEPPKGEVSIGHPGWTNDYQRRAARAFKPK